MPNRRLATENPGNIFSGREKMRLFKKSKNSSILIFILALGMMALLAPLGNTAAEDNMGQDLFAQGNSAYAKGSYDQAIVHYKAAIDREGYTSSLLYNLGNAYYMKNEIGQSILNYERALYLDPGNIDIEANLSLARKNTGLVMPDQTSWKTFFNGLTLNGWTWAGVIALCTFSLMILVNGIRPGILRGPVLKMMVCLCLLLFTAAGAGVAVQYGNLNRGVITGDNSRLRVSPFDSAAASGVVKSGKVVNLANTYQGYVFIKEANGQSGWIPEDAVSAVLPTDGNHQTQTSLPKSTVGKINRGGGESDMNKT
jgi:hypothetical protein